MSEASPHRPGGPPSWPRLVIVAGPNGAGKSTLVRSSAVRRLVTTPDDLDQMDFLNPDVLAVSARLAGASNPDIAAGRAVLMQARANIASRKTFGVETVVAGPVYRAMAADARREGYHISLFYIFLQHPDLHIDRVRQRAELGGHDVPVQRIRDRYEKSMENFVLLAADCDFVAVIDNSFKGTDEGKPLLIATKKPQDIWWLGDLTQTPEPLKGGLYRLSGQK